MQSSINSFYRVVKKGGGATAFADSQDDIVVASKPTFEYAGDETIRLHAPGNDTAEDDNHAKAFNVLPIEMNQRIAKYLDCDQDLDHFRRTCRATYQSVDGDGMSFWRRRFLESFEKPLKSLTNAQYRKEYLKRKELLNKGAKFTLGHTDQEEECLKVLRTLILEAFSDKIDQQDYESKNIAELRRFVQNHDLLQNIFNPHLQKHYQYSADKYRRPTEPFLQMIQALLAPLMFELDLIGNDNTFQFPQSQTVAYSTSAQQPIFTGPNGTSVNMPWLLHNLNFWKYHLKRSAEGTLFEPYNSLSASERPRFWDSLLRQPSDGEQSIGKHWKGAYGYVNERDIEDIRNGDNEEGHIQDEFGGDDEDTLQDLTLKLDTRGEHQWNAIFETALKSLQKPQSKARTRAQKRTADPAEVADRKSRSFRFTGKGADNAVPFLAEGWFNPMPSQDGVPGWQRMTMMKYWTDDHGNIDYASSLWAYEGVVLPGGQMIVGRWWSPTDDDPADHYTGPFIQWCVGGPQYEDDEEKEESEEL